MSNAPGPLTVFIYLFFLSASFLAHSLPILRTSARYHPTLNSAPAFSSSFSLLFTPRPPLAKRQGTGGIFGFTTQDPSPSPTPTQDANSDNTTSMPTPSPTPSSIPTPASTPSVLPTTSDRKTPVGPIIGSISGGVFLLIVVVWSVICFEEQKPWVPKTVSDSLPNWIPLRNDNRETMFEIGDTLGLGLSRTFLPFSPFSPPTPTPPNSSSTSLPLQIHVKTRHQRLLDDDPFCTSFPHSPVNDGNEKKPSGGLVVLAPPPPVYRRGCGNGGNVAGGSGNGSRRARGDAGRPPTYCTLALSPIKFAGPGPRASLSSFDDGSEDGWGDVDEEDTERERETTPEIPRIREKFSSVGATERKSTSRFEGTAGGSGSRHERNPHRTKADKPQTNLLTVPGLSSSGASFSRGSSSGGVSTISRHSGSFISLGEAMYRSQHPHESIPIPMVPNPGGRPTPKPKSKKSRSKSKSMLKPAAQDSWSLRAPSFISFAEALGNDKRDGSLGTAHAFGRAAHAADGRKEAHDLDGDFYESRLRAY